MATDRLRQRLGTTTRDPHVVRGPCLDGMTPGSKSKPAGRRQGRPGGLTVGSQSASAIHPEPPCARPYAHRLVEMIGIAHRLAAEPLTGRQRDHRRGRRIGANADRGRAQRAPRPVPDVDLVTGIQPVDTETDYRRASYCERRCSLTRAGAPRNGVRDRCAGADRVVFRRRSTCSTTSAPLRPQTLSALSLTRLRAHTRP